MSGVFRFDDFELRALQRSLLRAGRPVQIGGRALDLLVCLVEQRHRTVAKAELIDRAWPEQAVEPNNLAVQMWALRRLLGPQAIATDARRGYRFVLPLADDEPRAPASAAAISPVATPAAAALPVLAPMFGREGDLAQVQALLQAHRLVTLLGPPGVGKTRLALAVLAAQAALGRRTLRVDLAAVHTPAAVEDAVRLQLGQVGRPAGLAPNAAWHALVEDGSLLLLLDNCEHLADAVAALAGAMLSQAPGVVLLATSQRPLKLAAEQQLRLMPLAVPQPGADAADGPALQLLVARVQALDAPWRLADRDRAVAQELCRRLDGLPLAIELAAVRVPALGLRGVLARLHDRLRLLTGGAAPQRHTTLAAALDWSVALLDEPLQALFDMLGVFNGSCSVELAVAVGTACGLDEWAALDGIGRLAEHSLIVAEMTGDTPRLRMLETMRAHALQRLHAAGSLARLRGLHAEAVCRRLSIDAREREAGRMSADAALQAVRDDLDNVRSAMAWVLDPPADAPNAERPDAGGAMPPEHAAVGHSIIADAWPAMMLLGLHDEVARWMLALLPHLHDGTPPRTAGFMLLGLGKIGVRTPALPPHHRHALLLRARALLDTLPGAEFKMAVRQTLAQSACQIGNAAEALASADEAISLLRPGDLVSYRADLIVWRGIALALLGRPDDAAAARAEALPLCVPEGNSDFVFLLLCDLAELEALLGLHAEAAERWRFLTAAATARGIHSQVLAPLWAGLQGSLVALGDADAARAAAAEVWRHMALLGRPLEGCHFHAGLLALEGRAEVAGWLIGAADRQWHEAGERRLLTEAAARESTVGRLQAAADSDMLSRWQRHGRTLTPAQVGAALFGN